MRLVLNGLLDEDSISRLLGANADSMTYYTKAPLVGRLFAGQSGSLALRGIHIG